MCEAPGNKEQGLMAVVTHHALLSDCILQATLPIKGPQLLIHSLQRPGLSEAKERAQDGTAWLS